MKTPKLLIALAAVLCMAASCDGISISLKQEIPWWIEIVGKTYTSSQKVVDYFGAEYDFSVKIAGSNSSPDSLCFVLDLDSKLAGKNYSYKYSFNTFKGIFDKDNHTITLPKDQVFSQRAGYLDGYVLKGWSTADPHASGATADEDVVISVKPDCSEITILNAFGVQMPGTTNWLTLYYGNLTLSAQQPQ